MIESAGVLVARRVTGARTKLVLDVQGDWHEATRLYGSRLRGSLNVVADVATIFVSPRLRTSLR